MVKFELNIKVDGKELIEVSAPIENEILENYLKDLEGKNPTAKQIIQLIKNVIDGTKKK